mmetsp:Transcript_5028/g.8243  ORF Transcript_5028/g.8243 Transcript_5028/m.8243 type:complete len:335 (+) Transcript_5028:144-1148(+)
MSIVRQSTSKQTFYWQILPTERLTRSWLVSKNCALYTSKKSILIIISSLFLSLFGRNYFSSSSSSSSSSSIVIIAIATITTVVRVDVVTLGSSLLHRVDVSNFAHRSHHAFLPHAQFQEHTVILLTSTTTSTTTTTVATAMLGCIIGGGCVGSPSFAITKITTTTTTTTCSYRTAASAPRGRDSMHTLVWMRSVMQHKRTGGSRCLFFPCGCRFLLIFSLVPCSCWVCLLLPRAFGQRRSLHLGYRDVPNRLTRVSHRGGTTRTSSAVADTGTVGIAIFAFRFLRVFGSGAFTARALTIVVNFRERYNDCVFLLLFLLGSFTRFLFLLLLDFFE